MAYINGVSYQCVAGWLMAYTHGVSYRYVCELALPTQMKQPSYGVYLIPASSQASVLLEVLLPLTPY